MVEEAHGGTCEGQQAIRKICDTKVGTDNETYFHNCR